MGKLWQDVRYGARMLRRSPGFTLVAILALALGIGANTALFSVVYGVLLKPLPYANGKRIVVLDQSYPKIGHANVRFSVKEINDYRQQSQTLAEVEEYHQMAFILLNDKEPDRVQTGVVSAHFFDMLGVKPMLGRFFTDDDDKMGADPVLVLSYKYWMAKHGGDRNIIGKHFRMNDKVHTVVGVLPPFPQYPAENDVYMPTVACPFRSSAQMIEGRAHHMMRAFGLLKPGVDLQAAKADIALIAERMRQAYPDAYPDRLGFSATVDSMQDQLTHRARPMLIVLLVTAALVLLIACANVANLALARMSHREQELAVRSALGADRRRLVRQLLTESTMLSFAGGLLGLVFASLTLKLLVDFAARFTTRAAEVSINGWVLAFTLVISVLTGIIFGSAPAYSHRLDLVNSLKGRTLTMGMSKASRLRSALVVGQVAVSFVLLIGAGLMLRSFMQLMLMDVGYNEQNVLTFDVPLNFSRYTQPVDVVNFFQRAVAKLEGQPGVKGVGVTSGAPLTGGPSEIEFQIEGRAVDPAQKPRADAQVVTPNAFTLMGIPLIKGRFFTDADKAGAPDVVIVNQEFVRRYFPNEDPIGRRASNDGQHWGTIVGVVGDIKQYDLTHETLPTFYQSLAQAPNGTQMILKTADDPLNYVNLVRSAILGVDPEQPIADVKTLAELRDDATAATRLTAVLLALFAGLALTIAATGLSGVIAFLVSQRTHEIGIRMALGSTREQILSMILGQAVRMIGIGLAIGVVAAVLGSRMIRGLLFRTPTTDPLTFVGVGLLFIVVALVASYVPARRAATLDPLDALRSE